MTLEAVGGRSYRYVSNIANTMGPIEAERHRNTVTVTTDNKERMYGVIHLAVPAGFDPSDFDLTCAGGCSWKLAFKNAVIAHRFKRLMDEAERLVSRESPKASK